MELYNNPYYKWLYNWEAGVISLLKTEFLAHIAALCFFLNACDVWKTPPWPWPFGSPEGTPHPGGKIGGVATTSWSWHAQVGKTQWGNWSVVSYSSSHNHGNGEWVHPRLVSFTIGTFFASMIMEGRVNIYVATSEFLMCLMLVV